MSEDMASLPGEVTSASPIPDWIPTFSTISNAISVCEAVSAIYRDGVYRGCVNRRAKKVFAAGIDSYLERIQL